MYKSPYHISANPRVLCSSSQAAGFCSFWLSFLAPRGQFWGGHAAAGADRDRAVVKGTAAELPMEKGRDHGAGIQEQHGQCLGIFSYFFQCFGMILKHWVDDLKMIYGSFPVFSLLFLVDDLSKTAWTKTHEKTWENTMDSFLEFFWIEIPFVGFRYLPLSLQMFHIASSPFLLCFERGCF